MVRPGSSQTGAFDLRPGGSGWRLYAWSAGAARWCRARGGAEGVGDTGRGDLLMEGSDACEYTSEILIRGLVIRGARGL